jgi:hypothetical protein
MSIKSIRATLVILLCLIAKSALATEAYDYVTVVIEDFSMIEKNSQTSHIDKSASIREILMAQLQYNVRLKHIAEAAVTRLKKYNSNKNADELIRNSAELLSIEYLTLINDCQSTIDLNERYLNSPDAQILKNQGSFLKAISEHSATVNEFWSGFEESGLLLNYSILNAKRKKDLDGKINHLKITSNEKQILNRQLVESFGTKVQTPVSDNDSAVLKLSKSLYKLLNSDKFFTIDN